MFAQIFTVMAVLVLVAAVAMGMTFILNDGAGSLSTAQAQLGSTLTGQSSGFGTTTASVSGDPVAPAAAAAAEMTMQAFLNTYATPSGTEYTLHTNVDGGSTFENIFVTGAPTVASTLIVPTGLTLSNIAWQGVTDIELEISGTVDGLTVDGTTIDYLVVGADGVLENSTFANTGFGSNKIFIDGTSTLGNAVIRNNDFSDNVTIPKMVIYKGILESNNFDTVEFDGNGSTVLFGQYGTAHNNTFTNLDLAGNFSMTYWSIGSVTDNDFTGTTWGSFNHFHQGTVVCSGNQNFELTNQGGCED